MTFLRRFLIVVLGLVLLALPTLVRDWGFQYNERSYTPPDVPELNLAATPAPTATPQAVTDAQFTTDEGLRRGPVVVDFAHFGFLNPANLQPLADALADRGLGLRYWVSKVDTMALESSAQFPDQSEDLASQLKDASALVVVSPFFMWTPQEIAVTERFVADGGRLLLISDPDINGDFPSLVNILAEPFGVVFNDDYLYDTAKNDGNYTFFFNESAPAVEGETTGNAEALADAAIAFYGGRSIGGAVVAQLRSAPTTLSSLRTGQSGFITVAIGGVAGRGTAGRVLALSDFDVLSEVYRVRHDNQRMVEFVADFLSADQRNNTMADFPEYLGKAVALSYGAGLSIDANLLLQGAQLQQRLENTGRTLALINGHALNKPDEAGRDLIYLTDYTTAFSETTLLTDLGIQVITEAVTITVPVVATPVAPTKPEPKPTESTDGTPKATPESTKTDTKDTDQETPQSSETAQESLAVTATATLTATVTVTATVLPEMTPTIEPQLTPTLLPKVTPTVRATRALGTTDITTATTTAEPTTAPLTVTATISEATVLTATLTPETRVVITTYLETAEGLRFLADQTVLVAQSQRADGSLLLAVLGADRRGIDAGVTRLLANDFKDCVIGETLTFCSLSPKAAPTRSSSTTSTTGDKESNTGSSDTTKDDSSGSGNDDGGGNGGSEPTKTPAANRGVLLIDDNRTAAEGESSEADLYLQALIGAGHSVDLWSAKSQGSPTADDLTNYTWVIWSNAGYADGKLSIEDMDLVFGYVRQGGRLTLSSRFPLPGIEEASTLRDVVIDGVMADLVKGLPDEPITLSEEQNAANLSPLAADESGVEIALRRGPASEDAEAPVLVVLTDATESDSNARFMIVGMSLTGLSEATSSTLINNMATWMMAE